MGLLQLLRKRMETGQRVSIDSVVKWLPRVTIPLGDIMDTNQQLLEGHVVIGFTRQGAEYLLSYQLRIDYDDTDLAGAPCHYYSLHWWRFDPSRPLKHVCSVAVFKDQYISQELLLTICLPRDKPWIIVHGHDLDNNRSCVDPHDCYVSIVPSPVTMDTDHTPPTVSYTFSYPLHSPMPMFTPLCLEIENCVLINSGCDLYAVSYGDAISSLDEPCPLQSHQSESSSRLDYTEQWFASKTDATPTNDTVSMLDITVYRGNEPLSIVGGAGGRGLVSVCQWSMDIETWLFDQLEEIVTTKGREKRKGGQYSLHSISDYDLRILEVYGSQWVVVFVVVVTARVTTSSPVACMYYTTTLHASWDIRKSSIELISNSKPSLSKKLQFYPAVKPGLHTVSAIQKKLRPCHTSYSEHIQALTNYTVFSGKSLLYLHHPCLPFSLKMFHHSPHMSSDDDNSSSDLSDSSNSYDHRTYYYDSNN